MKMRPENRPTEINKTLSYPLMPLTIKRYIFVVDFLTSDPIRALPNTKPETLKPIYTGLNPNLHPTLNPNLHPTLNPEPKPYFAFGEQEPEDHQARPGEGVCGRIEGFDKGP